MNENWLGPSGLGFRRIYELVCEGIVYKLAIARHLRTMRMMLMMMVAVLMVFSNLHMSNVRVYLYMVFTRGPCHLNGELRTKPMNFHKCVCVCLCVRTL